MLRVLPRTDRDVKKSKERQPKQEQLLESLKFCRKFTRMVASQKVVKATIHVKFPTYCFSGPLTPPSYNVESSGGLLREG